MSGGIKPETAKELAVGITGSEPVPETHAPEVGDRQLTAAGVPAAVKSLRYCLHEMGAGRSVKTLLAVNQKQGFDCPSCAWPDPDGKRATAEFCENGARAVAHEADTRRIGAEFFAANSIESLTRQSDRWLEAQGRLTQPLVRRKGSDHYEPIDWDAAFKLIGDELNALASPDEALFYTSGRTSNEAAFMYQLFARQFGTNNLPDCSNMCHESTSFGLAQSIGIGKTTIKLDDFDHADAIFVIGQNPGTCHPRMLTYLQRAVRNGAKLISVNPLLETGMIRFKHPQEVLHLLGPGTQMACLHVPVRINGDIAVLKGVMKEMLEADEQSGGAVLDHAFIREKTTGYDAFANDLRETNWESIVENSGVSREVIREAAKIAIESKRMIVCWAMGITQHKSGVGNVQTIVNFALLRGQIGRSGAGLCAVRGHSNVQGDRTMGIWEKVGEKFLTALGKEFNFAPPAKHGYDTVRGIEAMRNGTAKILIAMGGNLLLAAPDTKQTSEALGRCRLTAYVATKLNRGHLITGEQSLILPCLGRTERDERESGDQIVSVEDTVGCVHSSRGVLKPASGQLKSEPAIVAGIARATLKDRYATDWEPMAEDYDVIRNHIERVIPGFDQYNRRVREPGGFYLPNPPREGRFSTPDGRAQFFVHPIPRHELGVGKYLLTTVRSHDQFNTTIYADNDRYRGIFNGRRVVFLNKRDMAEQNLTAGQWVDLVSHFGDERRRAERFLTVAYDIPRKCAAAYFPETNALVPLGSTADGSNQPASKSVLITIEPSA